MLILRCNEDAALACAVLAVGMLCSSLPQPSLPYFLEPLTCISEDDVHQAQSVHYTPLSSLSRCAEKREQQPFLTLEPLPLVLGHMHVASALSYLSFTFALATPLLV